MQLQQSNCKKDTKNHNKLRTGLGCLNQLRICRLEAASRNVIQFGLGHIKSDRENRRTPVDGELGGGC